MQRRYLIVIPKNVFILRSAVIKYIQWIVLVSRKGVLNTRIQQNIDSHGGPVHTNTTAEVLLHTVM
jgi:hypothetical protein